MGGFLSSLFAEMGARRRRLRAALGDRGQGLVEFLVLGGLAVGSLGLFVRDWMPAAAPWGFALPVVFVLGYILIEARRQASLRMADGNSDVDDEGRTASDRTASGYDWLVLLWSFACALAGAAAFVIAYTSQPPPNQEEEIWTPPESSVSVDISP